MKHAHEATKDFRQLQKERNRLATQLHRRTLEFRDCQSQTAQVVLQLDPTSGVLAASHTRLRLQHAIERLDEAAARLELADRAVTASFQVTTTTEKP